MSRSATTTLPSRPVTSLPSLDEALVAQVGGLVEGELETDRIDRHDGGEQRGGAAGAAGDQVALRHAPVADAAGDRGPELGEFEIELGLLDQRLVGRDRGLRVAKGLRALIEDLLA